jgi:hypothetical protein
MGLLGLRREEKYEKIQIFVNVWMHKIIGVCALVGTVVAVNSGIMDKLPLGSCYYETNTIQQ